MVLAPYLCKHSFGDVEGADGVDVDYSLERIVRQILHQREEVASSPVDQDVNTAESATPNQ